jgi:hypothetical protein
MRFIRLGLGAALLVASCAQQPVPAASGTPPSVESSGSSGPAGHFGLRGQVMISHPPGNEDALAMVRREATARCPGGFVIRSLHTDAPATGDFTVGLLNYQAAVDCAGQGAD